MLIIAESDSDQLIPLVVETERSVIVEVKLK